MCVFELSKECISKVSVFQATCPCMCVPKLSLNDIDIKNEKIYIYIAYRHI